MKKVLIALGYNPYAQKIAETGYRLAKEMNASTILLHVISDPTYYSSINYSPIMGFENLGNPFETDPVEELKKVAQNYLDTSKKKSATIAEEVIAALEAFNIKNQNGEALTLKALLHTQRRKDFLVSHPPLAIMVRM